MVREHASDGSLAMAARRKPIRPHISVSISRTTLLRSRSIIKKLPAQRKTNCNVPLLFSPTILATHSHLNLVDADCGPNVILGVLKNSTEETVTYQCIVALERLLKDRQPELRDLTTVDGYGVLVMAFGQLARKVDSCLKELLASIRVFKLINCLDKRFNVMFRTCGGLKILSSCIRSFIFCDARAYQSAGELMLICCRSNASVQFLWRSGTISGMLQRLPSVPSSRLSTITELTLRITNRVTEKSLTAPSFMAKGLTVALLQLLRVIWDGPFRVKNIVLKNFLHCIRKLLQTKTARNTFHEQHALPFIQEICRTTVSEELFEAAAAVLLFAFPPKKLPLSSRSHPLFLPTLKSSFVLEEIQRIAHSPDSDREEENGDKLCRTTAPQTLQDSALPTNLVEFFPENLQLAQPNLPSVASADQRTAYRHELSIQVCPSPVSSSSSFLMKGMTLRRKARQSTLPVDPKKQTKTSSVRLDKTICSLERLKLTPPRQVSEAELTLNSEESWAFYPYQKVAHPDTAMFDCLKHSGSTVLLSEPLLPATRLEERRRILEDELARALQPAALGIRGETVYDAEEILQTMSAARERKEEIPESCHGSQKATNGTACEHAETSLVFDSLFESGNLQKAIQVREYEYDLLLFSDVNRSTTGQWFYFQIRNMKADTPYRFNIINCQKPACFFGYGMQPLVFSLRDATNGLPAAGKSNKLPGNGGWKRKGNNICYYRNNYKPHGPLRMQEEEFRKPDLTYFYTLTFTLEFDYADDIVYVAYHYPYTYTTLQRNLSRWQERSQNRPEMFFASQTLTQTLAGLPVPLLTITGSKSEQVRQPNEELHEEKKYVFLTGRVHPSESNASHVIDGMLDFLLSGDEEARKLLKKYIFKIVPMLNPDGVVCGNSRCSLAGVDLNRQWRTPSLDLFPSIFYTKSLMEAVKTAGKDIHLFVDCHGHSNQKNVFFYGCSPLDDWFHPKLETSGWMSSSGHLKGEFKDFTEDCIEDLLTQSDSDAKSFPLAMKRISRTISLRNCSYEVQKSRENCARVTVWRQLDCPRSYTLESSFCGFDCGSYQGCQMEVGHLQQTGRDVIRTLVLVPAANCVSTDSDSMGSNGFCDF